MKHSYALALACLTLAGCVGTENRGLESVHQPVVSRTDYVYDLPLGSSPASAREQLGGWFQSLRLGYGDRVSIDGPADPLAQRSVADVLGDYGMLLEDRTVVTQGERPPGTLRVVVSRATATVPGCPDWSRRASPDYDNHSLSNYGCGVNTTLAAMLANPEDLIEGRRPASSVDAATSAKAIRSYRAKVPTGEGDLKAESTKGGN